MPDEQNTLQKIHTAAIAEFRENGFQKASLRNIVKSAGVTTGAFYGYYDSKEQLFCAIAAPVDLFMEEYKKVQNSFVQLSPEEQTRNLGVVSSNWMLNMTDYLYDNKTAFQLVLTCSEGTRYATFLDELVRIEVNATHAFYKILRSQGINVPEIDPDLEHMLVSGMFASYFELIIHELPRDKAKNYVHQMYRFQSAGWSELMGIPHVEGETVFDNK